MKQSQLNLARLIRTWLVTIIICASAAFPLTTEAQLVTQLIQFTNVWKYDRSGLDLGSAWRTNDFDDSAWPLGPGLLGFEDVIAPYQIHVPSGLGTIIPVSGSVTTFYFRTTFQFSGTTNFTQLFATNLVDDGCAIWLNGQLAGTVRLPTNGAFNATTFASSGPTVEGQLDVINLQNLMREGENQIAVEVHQQASTSGDVIFGMKLVSSTPTTLVITNQPQSLFVAVGENATFQIGAGGGPVTYRWYKDGVLLPSTSNTLAIINTRPANAGNYLVTCSNALTVVTSDVARLTVVSDLNGPSAINAIADNGLGFNTVNIRFSELLILNPPALPFSARNATNYLITRLGTTNTLRATNVLASGSQVLLQLDATDTNWVRFGEYVLTINNVADIKTNIIAPGTQMPILWNHSTNLIQASHEWDFHNSAIFDPDVFNESWTACDYRPGLWWGRGYAPFYGIFNPGFPCAELGSPLTPLGWQPEPMLFRTTFNYPAHWPAAGSLRLRLSVDDGFVLYLNGVEIYRYNSDGTAGTPISTASRAAAIVNTPNCVTNIALNITNLLPGANCFAAAVLQPNANDNDLYFVLDANVVVPLGPELPATPPPTLHITQASADNLRLSWDNGGYILERSTNLSFGALSYPYGPWTPVPQLANPYHWPLTNGETQFFRLRK